MADNYKEWFGQSVWVYPDEDRDFLPMLLNIMKDHFQNYAQWKSNVYINDYPQYLCSAKFSGGTDDIVHLWRDGQTWWQKSGEFYAKEKDSIELLLRKCIDDYIKKKELVN